MCPTHTEQDGATMGAVFLSYSRDNAEVAEALAATWHSATSCGSTTS